MSPRVHADDNDQNDRESKIQIGFRIAPVKLNLDGKDRSLVGLGSYIVNGENDCNAKVPGILSFYALLGRVANADPKADKNTKRD